MSPLFIAIILFLLAVGLALLDILVPSGGMLMVLSLAAAIASVLFGFRSGATEGMVMLTVAISAIPVVLIVALRVWEHTPIGRRIVLKPPSEKHGDDTSSSNDPLRELIGAIGVTQSSLMPTGHVRINHRNFNASTQGEIIEAAQFVEVTDVRQRNLMVRTTSRRPTDKPPETESAGQSKPVNDNLLDLPADQLGLNSIDE